MAKDFAKAFYNSAAWQHCRDAYIAHVHGLCERCKRPGFIVHHKCYLTPANIEDPNVTLNFDNLEYLCQDCHNLEHGSGDHKAMKDGLFFDENGDLRPVKAPPVLKSGGGSGADRWQTSKKYTGYFWE